MLELDQAAVRQVVSVARQPCAAARRGLTAIRTRQSRKFAMRNGQFARVVEAIWALVVLRGGTDPSGLLDRSVLLGRWNAIWGVRGNPDHESSGQAPLISAMIKS